MQEFFSLKHSQKTHLFSPPSPSNLFTLDRFQKKMENQTSPSTVASARKLEVTLCFPDKHTGIEAQGIEHLTAGIQGLSSTPAAAQGGPGTATDPVQQSSQEPSLPSEGQGCC